MKIKSTSRSIRLMTLAFKLAKHMHGKSDRRRTQIKNTAKKLISAAKKQFNSKKK